jgi:hypothetical protein
MQSAELQIWQFYWYVNISSKPQRARVREYGVASAIWRWRFRRSRCQHTRPRAASRTFELVRRAFWIRSSVEKGGFAHSLSLYTPVERSLNCTGQLAFGPKRKEGFLFHLPTRAGISARNVPFPPCISTGVCSGCALTHSLSRLNLQISNALVGERWIKRALVRRRRRRRCVSLTP